MTMNEDLAELKSRYEPREPVVINVDRQLTCARFTACGRYLLAAAHDGLVRRFDATREELPELKPLAGHSGWVQRVVVPIELNGTSGDEEVFSADSWGLLRCRSFIDETIDPRWVNTTAHDGWILDLAISPGGALLATCGIDRAVRVWSADDGEKLNEFLQPEWEVLSVVFSPDEKSVVAGDLSGRIRQWDLESNEVVREFDASPLHKSDRLQEVGGVRLMKFDPAGSLLLCAGTRPKGGGNVQGIPTVLVFDWKSGELKKRLELGLEGDVYPTDLAFHPAGFLMASSSGNPGTGKLTFRRLEDETPFFETNKMPNCHSLAFHPQSNRLAIVATNGSSNGNGRQLDKQGKYPGNYSPIHIWKLPSAMT